MPRDLPPRSPFPDDLWLDHREDWLMVHLRFADDMDAALQRIAERQEPKPECPLCRGYGWLMATDPHKPWNEHKTQCWECS